MEEESIASDYKRFIETLNEGTERERNEGGWSRFSSKEGNSSKELCDKLEQELSWSKALLAQNNEKIKELESRLREKERNLLNASLRTVESIPLQTKISKLEATIESQRYRINQLCKGEFYYITLYFLKCSPINVVIFIIHLPSTITNRKEGFANNKREHPRCIECRFFL